ncbi:MAG: hypothetical protein KAW12_27845 [Candidatus Aminicenantes bacterium]|nr:hypothetical protein [Candidatus Aminicenantes bacterium]
MKKVIIICLIGFLLSVADLVAQQEKEDIRETVKVVNVEVPVRVYYKGKPVDNLTKADFKLYENRKRQEINGCIIKRKKMKLQELEMTAEQEKSWASRYFVLVFRITHYNEYIKKGVQHIFDNVLKKPDQLLVFVNDRTVSFKNLQDKDAARAELDKLLQDASRETRNKLLLYFRQIETELDKHKFDMKDPLQTLYTYVQRFLVKYMRIWKDFKKRYLIPDINKYYNFSRFLRDIRKEKWVINFYQFELFPDIMINSRNMREIKRLLGIWQSSLSSEPVNFARIITRQLNEIQMERNFGKDFPAKEVAKIFHNVGATFHSIFMRTTVSTLMEDAEYKQISTELEHTLREITERTGGKLIVSNKIDTALDSISEVEDIYYILTYAAQNPDKVGKIKIKTSGKKHKLIYSPNLKTGYLGDYLETKEIKGTPVKIRELKFQNGKLFFVISDFYRQEKVSGKLSIRIRVKNERGISIFDQGKTISATQKEIRINLKIPGVKKGKYDFVVDVKDLFTRKVATDFFKAVITPVP